MISSKQGDICASKRTIPLVKLHRKERDSDVVV